jgi:hypothetical protein
MADEEMEQALRRPLRRHELPPPLLENAELRAIVHDPLPPVEEEINPTVMMLLEADREEIDAARSFTQCDRIQESGCIYHSQYIQLLRQLKHKRMLDSYKSNVEKRLLDIEPYVLLLQRLASTLVQHSPKNGNTRDRICTSSDPSYCSIKNHKHWCPYDFLATLFIDLLNTKPIVETHFLDTEVVWPEDPSDELGIYVTGDPDMYINNLLLVVQMLQR